MQNCTIGGHYYQRKSSVRECVLESNVLYVLNPKRIVIMYLCRFWTRSNASATPRSNARLHALPTRYVNAVTAVKVELHIISFPKSNYSKLDGPLRMLSNRTRGAENIFDVLERVSCLIHSQSGSVEGVSEAPLAMSKLIRF
jgi:hypothetical protein